MRSSTATLILFQQSLHWPLQICVSPAATVTPTSRDVSFCCSSPQHLSSAECLFDRRNQIQSETFRLTSQLYAHWHFVTAAASAPSSGTDHQIMEAYQYISRETKQVVGFCAALVAVWASRTPPDFRGADLTFSLSQILRGWFSARRRSGLRGPHSPLRLIIYHHNCSQLCDYSRTLASNISRQARSLRRCTFSFFFPHK